MPWDLTQKAVAHHTDLKWVLIYVERWLKAPMLMPDGTLKHRTMGTPQGGPNTPPTQSGFLSKPEPAIQPITGIQADTRI
jgi:retron-type reverse transcriptase